jgi:hypothetical protein
MSRIIKRTEGTSVEVVFPSTRNMVERAKMIVSDTLVTLSQTAASRGLTADDAQVLSACIRAIRALSAEERDLDKQSKVKNLSDSELKALAKKIFSEQISNEKVLDDDGETEE